MTCTSELAFRLIPARAGNTPKIFVAVSVRPAHPRSRGEHHRRVALLALTDGSSPLARGTPRMRIALNVRSRLIPARAGNTRPTVENVTPWTAHPRSRGEHDVDAMHHCIHLGSSPLARGTLDGAHRWDQAKRLIPARAGNTALIPLIIWVVSGSSPLARGTLRRTASAHRRVLAHPRSRGEHKKDTRPLAVFVWLIPARAGNTQAGRSTKSESRAHPRSRGEHTRAGVLPFLVFGSSPLARGTRV